MTTKRKPKGIENPWSGVFAATLCPFNADNSIDEEGLRAYARYLAGVDGMKGLVCNGHTGEVMGLRTAERPEVTRIFAEEVGDQVKIVSGVCTEGSFEAIDHALAAKEAGADAILLMPPHHWLRFGRDSRTAVGFFADVAAGAAMPIIVHQYPDWTKACYSLDEMLAMTEIPQVAAIKMGTRNMARLGHDYRALKAKAPDIPILTCHDEYLLASLLAGADGALVGFAGFVPKLIVALVRAALAGDLAKAREVQESVYPLAKLVYRFGEPSSDAHQRMKAAMTLQGRFPSMVVRPPLRPLNDADMARIKQELTAAGYDIQ
jgi:4-hydroxy-tetrahydrodipicolinate synthase